VAGFLVVPGLSRAQQKIAYVDIAAIMKAIPDAQDAQRQLDGMVDGWQKELDRMQKDWQDKYNDYDKRKLILTDQGRANAEKDLQELERSILEFRDKKFGQNGELFAKEDELMKPIQNMVFDQVKVLAKELNYDYVLDKSGGVMMIFANEKYDLTNVVVERIKKALPPRATPGQAGPGGQQQPGSIPPGTGGQQPTPIRTDNPDKLPSDRPK
jgi:outer membrane protein